jgi:hypothetical protein
VALFQIHIDDMKMWLFIVVAANAKNVLNAFKSRCSAVQCHFILLGVNTVAAHITHSGIRHNTSPHQRKKIMTISSTFFFFFFGLLLSFSVSILLHELSIMQTDSCSGR